MINLLIDIREECDYIIDYENGISCNYNTINGELITYNFYNDKYKRLVHVNDESLENLSNSHWSNHYKKNNTNIINNIDDLLNFNEFNKLYYIGGSMDGMLFKHDGTAISTPFYLDEIYFECWEKIYTSRKECEEILDSLNKEWILESKILEIDSYDEDEDEDYVVDHYTLRLLVKLPNDIYSEIIGNNLYWSTEENKKSFIKLKENVREK